MEVLKTLSIMHNNIYFVMKIFVFAIVITKASAQYTPETYIARFNPVADSLSRVYGAPSAIILSVACLESGYGSSAAARLRNNHFGINHGRSRYESAEASFAAFCVLLTTAARYRALFNLCVYDYKGWAYGLQLSGYATDCRYAEKLIWITEKYIRK